MSHNIVATYTLPDSRLLDGGRIETTFAQICYLLVLPLVLNSSGDRWRRRAERSRSSSLDCPLGGKKEVLDFATSPV